MHVLYTHTPCKASTLYTYHILLLYIHIHIYKGYKLAAILGSKCYYHLQEYNDSLRLALIADELFNVNIKNEYIDTILTCCIDTYKNLRLQKSTEGTLQKSTDEPILDSGTSGAAVTSPQIDIRIENIIESMFKRCYNDLCYEQAIGIAIDTLRIDKIYEICTLAISNNYTSILNYTFEICQYTRSIISREFRLNVIKILVDLYYTLPIPDYTNICYALQYLNKPEEVAKVLQTLVSTTDIANDATNDAEKGHNYDPSVYENNILQAYQICFDLKEAENQGFILKIVEAFTPIPTTTTTATNTNNPPQINRSNVPMAATEEEDNTTVDPETVPLLQQADTTATATATGNNMNTNAYSTILTATYTFTYTMLTYVTAPITLTYTLLLILIYILILFIHLIHHRSHNHYSSSRQQ